MAAAVCDGGEVPANKTQTPRIPEGRPAVTDPIDDAPPAETADQTAAGESRLRRAMRLRSQSPRPKDRAGRSLRRRFVAVAALVGLLAVGSQSVLLLWTGSQASDLRVVNLAGRQRMLAQRIVKSITVLATDPNEQTVSQARSELRTSLAEFERVEQGLRLGDAGLGLPGMTGTPVAAMLAQARPEAASLIATGRRVLREGRPSPAVSGAARAVGTRFTRQMNESVFAIEAEAVARVRLMRRAEMVVLALTAIVLLAALRFVLAPAASTLEGQSEAIDTLGRIVDEGRTLRSDNTALRESLDEHQLNERRLSERSALLSGVLEAIPQAVAFKDTASVVRVCNEPYARACGLPSAEAAIGLTDWHMEWPANEARLEIAADRQVMDTLRPLPETVCDRTWGGQRRSVRVQRRPLTRPDGQVIGVLLVGEDVTEETLAETRRRALETLAAKTPEGRVLCDAEGRIQWVSPGFERMFGYRCEEILGEHPGRLLQGPDTDPQTVATIRRAMQAGETADVEIWNYTRGGDRLRVRLSIHPVTDEEGHVVGYAATQADATAQNAARQDAQRADARIEAIAAAGVTGVAVSDADGTIHFANDEFLRIVGGDREALKSGRLDRRQFIPAEARGRDAARLRILAETGHCDVEECELVRVDGSRVAAATGLSLTRPPGTTGSDDGGEIVCVALDLTDGRDRENRLQVSADGSQRQAATLGTVLNGLSHAAAESSRRVSESLEQIGEGRSSAQRFDAVEAARQSAARLQSLVSRVGLLSSSDVDAPAIAACSPHGVICDVLRPLQRGALDKGLTVSFQWRGRVPAAIRTDAGRFSMVVHELAANAVRFTARGEIRVEARCEWEREQLHVTVSDTGPGLPGDRMESVFEPFTHADESVPRRYGTAGLGLAVARRVVTALGGTISVRSQPGQGSAFSFYVDSGPLADVAAIDTPADVVSDPIAPSPPAAATPPAAFNPPGETFEPVEDLDPETSFDVDPLFETGEESEAALFADVGADQPGLRTPAAADDAPESHPLEGLNVLLVEDGEVNRKMISLLLRRAGASVDAVENGLLGSQRACGERFDLVLMDMQMPVMDGYSATRAIRERGLKTPVVALTAETGAAAESRCRAAGCDGFLSKPIDPARLIETVARSAERPVPGSRPEPAGGVVRSTLPPGDSGITRIVRAFLDSRDACRLELQRLLETDDRTGIRAAAFKLRGEAITCGFTALSNAAADLQRAAGATGDTADLRQAFTVVETELARVAAPLVGSPASRERQ